MDRRHYLTLVAAAGLAGCRSTGPGAGSDGGGGQDATDAGGPSTGTAGGDTDAGTAGVDAAGDGTATATATATDATAGSGPAAEVVAADLPVAKSQLHRGAPKDAIPAITDPVFADDWSEYTLPAGGLREEEADISLKPDYQVIGVERDGEARAYPLRVLNWHEVVNDTFGGPLLVTFCPLCGSGVTAVRKVDGEETTFGVSGFLWHSDLVMYDEATGSLWSQILAQAIRGPMTGARLELVPSTLTTWSEWRTSHPDTKVLVPPPESSTVAGPNEYRDYTVNPYGGYTESSQIGIGQNERSDDRLAPKTQVLGISHGGTARAYPRDVVTKERVINDVVDGLPVLVAATPDDAMVAYERTVDGETLTFATGDDPAFVRAGGSRWRVTTGRAVDGPHEGVELASASDRTRMFWFAWVDFHPDTEIYGR